MTNTLDAAQNQKIAFFLPGLYDGGAERIMLNLAKGIVDRGHPVDMVLARAEGPFMDQIPACVRVIDLKAPRVLSSTPALVKYLRSEKPAALLSILYANIVAVWAKRLAGSPVRVVLAEHNTLSSVAEGEHDLRLQVYPILARLFYPWSDAIVAVSQGVADDLAQRARLHRDRIQVIYNPVITPELFEKSAAALQHPWYEPGEPPVLLAVGRLTAQKGFDVLIRAFAQIRKNRAARLLILGEGEERSALESLCRELKVEQDVSMPGFVSNPYPFMARSNAFVLSSRWEGLPTVLVEAMSLGIAIVSTDCPSGPREILKNGNYGCLVPVDNPFSLAAAITTTLNDRDPCPPKESWAPFDLDAVVDKYIDVLLNPA
jgi:glycosyltransferase involved in cell wall biosynthesis